MAVALSNQRNGFGVSKEFTHMTTPEIEEFAKILIKEVRDAAIQSNDRELRPGGGSPVGKRWRDAAQGNDLEKIGRVLIPDIVDDTLFYLLRAIDEGLLPLSFQAKDGKKVDLSVGGKGELAGWYTGSWRESGQERFSDYFSDLR
jgi:hypothetical protein